MTSKKLVDEESWSSFHRKYHSNGSGLTSRRDVSSWQSSMCFSWSMNDDDDDEKGWFSAFWDVFHESPEKKGTARMLCSDDDSSSSIDGSGKISRRRLGSKKQSKRRQGNIKISNLTR